MPIPHTQKPMFQRASGTLNENICKRELGAGEMAHQLRAQGALPKDLDLVPRIKRSNVLFWPSACKALTSISKTHIEHRQNEMSSPSESEGGEHLLLGTEAQVSGPFTW